MGLAAWLLLVPVRLLGSDLGRRLATVIVLTTVFVAGMGVLYDHADRPTASARPAATSAPRPGARADPEQAGGPGAVAVDWFAGRLGVPASRVRALGSQRLGPGRLRVLVLADANSRQPTAWVTLRRTRGGWTVTS